MRRNYGYGDYRGRMREEAPMGKYAHKSTKPHKELEHKLHEIMECVEHHSMATHAASMGNYEAEEDSIKILDDIMVYVCEFVEILEEEVADSHEEAQIIKKHKKKMLE